ncbi:MAG TPA: extracellular solute-binding protein [Candidatus Binatia bacterium]|jgi:ABC-type Fe3+ transport system substrate-binding protein|nr:extracellular solute-binding protein [Candidatus Binatia bacterium]
MSGRMIGFFNVRIIVLIGAIVLASGAASAQSAKPGEWEKTVELAKKEGKVVVSIPASTELRAAIERSFENRYGIDVEPVVGRASAIVRKIVDESKAGVRYVDLHMGGSESLVTGMLPEGILEPIEPLMLLSEVRDPKQWWGGHIWVDNAKKFIYSTQAFQTENLWINTQMMKADQVRSFDDLLDERLRDRIGMLDPRAGGSGSSTWSYLREIKGEEYLKKLVGQKLSLSRDQRVLADILAKGKIALVIGLTYYSYAPFIKAGLPLAPLAAPKEGIYVAGGSGHLVVLKNAPHPNAMKLFANWFLSREGQEVYSRAMHQATRRLDVDVKWLREVGVTAAKDALTIDQYYKLENQSEAKIKRLREPAADLARKLLG